MSRSGPIASHPAASTATLLCNVLDHRDGVRVRTLGCVIEMRPGKSLLLLSSRKTAFSQHTPTIDELVVAKSGERSRDSAGAERQPVVLVNYAHVVESMSGIQVGEWVNVIGYARPTARVGHLQAVILWPAGAVNPDAFELAVQERQSQTRKTGDRTTAG